MARVMRLQGMMEKISGREKAAYSYPLGSPVIVRTVTMIFVGILSEVTRADLVLTEASWIPETGRWNEMVARGDCKEIEPYQPGPVWINRAALVDFCLWPASVELPRTPK